MAGWLTADFREREPQIAANMKAMMLTTPVEGYIACCEALSTLDQRELLPKIKSPTLVIAGRHDMSTTVADGEFMRSRIPGASMTILDAAHISNVEQPHAFTDALVGLPDATLSNASLRGAKRRSNPSLVATATMDSLRRFAPRNDDEGDTNGRQSTPRRRHGPAPKSARQ